MLLPVILSLAVLLVASNADTPAGQRTGELDFILLYNFDILRARALADCELPTASESMKMSLFLTLCFASGCKTDVVMVLSEGASVSSEAFEVEG